MDRCGMIRGRMPGYEQLGRSMAVVAVLALGACTGSWLKVEGKTDGKIDGKIGVIDTQQILDGTNAGKKAKDSVVAFSESRTALMELDEKELRRMEQEFAQQASVLSPAARQEREEQFRRRMQEYQQKVAELNREVQEKQKDVLDRFRDKIEAVVAKVAKRLGLEIVVDRSKGGPTFYHEASLDISSQVIEEFDREYP